MTDTEDAAAATTEPEQENIFEEIATPFPPLKIHPDTDDRA